MTLNFPTNTEIGDIFTEGALTIEGDTGVIVNVAVGLTSTDQFAKLELIKTGSGDRGKLH